MNKKADHYLICLQNVLSLILPKSQVLIARDTPVYP